MDYETAVRVGELVLLKRQRDKARKECDQAFRALQQSKQDGTYTEELSRDYWEGPFNRYQVLEAQVLGLAPIAQATIDKVSGRVK